MASARRPHFVAQLGAAGRRLPRHVQREFEEYLKSGRLEHRFPRLRCKACHAEKLVAFSCKRRSFCPSCAARRMSESAALLADEVLLHANRRHALHIPPGAPRVVDDARQES